MSKDEMYDKMLEDILKFTHYKRILSCTEVIEYTGMSRDYCRNHFNIGKSGIPAVRLAAALAKM